MNEHKPTTLYERLPNGKYSPVAEHLSYDYWRHGDYIVSIKPGCTSISRRLWVNRKRPEFEALVKRFKEKIINKIFEKRDEPVLPKDRKLTKKQLEAFEMWKKAFKTNKVYLKSIHDVIEESLIDLEKELQDID